MKILVIFISVLAAVYAEVQRTSSEASGSTTAAPTGKSGTQNGSSGARTLLEEEPYREPEPNRVGNALPIGNVGNPQTFGGGLVSPTQTGFPNPALPNPGIPNPGFPGPILPNAGVPTGGCAGGCICRDALIALGIIGPGSPLFPTGPGGQYNPNAGIGQLPQGGQLFPMGPGGQPYPLGPMFPMGPGSPGGLGYGGDQLPGQLTPNYPGQYPQGQGPLGPYPGQPGQPGTPGTPGTPGQPGQQGPGQQGPFPGYPGNPFLPGSSILMPNSPPNQGGPLGPNIPYYPSQQGPGGQYPGGTPQYPGGSPQYPGGSPQYPGGSPQYPGGSPQFLVPGQPIYPGGPLFNPTNDQLWPGAPGGGTFPVGTNPFNPSGNTFPELTRPGQQFLSPQGPQGPQGPNQMGPGGSPTYPEGGNPFGLPNQPGGPQFQTSPFGTQPITPNQPQFPGQQPNTPGGGIFPVQQGSPTYPGQTPGQQPFYPGNQGIGMIPILPVGNSPGGMYPGSQIGSPGSPGGPGFPFMQPEGNTFLPGGPGQGFPANLTPETVAQLLQQCVLLQTYMKSQPGLVGQISQQFQGNQPTMTGNQFVTQSQVMPIRYGTQLQQVPFPGYPNLSNYIKAGLSLLDESGEDGSTDKKSGSKKPKSSH